jgi:hypothetical protein
MSNLLIKIFIAAIIGSTFISNITCSRSSDWISLFDGHSLSGWKSGENPGSFSVVNGQILCNGPRSHLFYMGDVQKSDFKNFEFKVDVLTKPGAKSGIFFHTEFQEDGWLKKGYEVQINNSYRAKGTQPELKKTGSLYSIRNLYKSTVKDDEWFTLQFSVQGKRIKVYVNGIFVVDYVEPENPIRNSKREKRVLSSGTFALQCHDEHSKVFIKNIMVKPLADKISAEQTDTLKMQELDDIYVQLTGLNLINFPLIDFHVHLKGGLSLEKALELSRQTGIYYGIAPNCGLGYPITDDEGIYQYINSMAGLPVFLGMQAEGREWTTLFSKEAIAKFDYVYTDASTFTDEKGNRIHLWKKEEVDIKDEQVFMDMYVEKILSILNNEPIDIFVNPTFLPELIRNDYEKLWTKERIQKVVDAAIKNDIAIEINARYKIPSPRFIKIAKEAGAKFSLGTNNRTPDLGRLEYCLEMIEKCNLTAADMFMPRPDGKKAIQRHVF